MERRLYMGVTRHNAVDNKLGLVSDNCATFCGRSQKAPTQLRRGPMSMFSRMFRKKAEAASAESPSEEPLVPVPIPALGVLLLNLERQKGSPLAQEEVLAARDKAVCMMLPLSAKRAMDEKRGYEDIDPENAWSDWLAFRNAAQRGEP